MAFAYVIALYIVYMKIDERGNSESGKVKNRTIELIYGARTAVRMGLLLFVLAECSRQLMLKRYTVIAISIPLLLACLYMGSRGTRGMQSGLRSPCSVRCRGGGCGHSVFCE